VCDNRGLGSRRIGVMNLLALETSSPIGSIALLRGDDVFERFIQTPREQTELVLPFIDDVLDAAGVSLRELDAIVFGRGPGSFTGLRIAAAVTQGLGFASGVPAVGVSSLEALAQRAWRELGADDVLVLVDARMQEVFAARYVITRARAMLRGEERLCRPDALLAPGAVVGDGWTGVGSGFSAYADALAPLTARAARIVPSLVPSARDLLVAATEEVAAGRLLAPEEALPTYLRDESAWRR
jgi:tRNA threonylcarbamoyladenosine biosynthesis protein TsaB